MTPFRFFQKCIILFAHTERANVVLRWLRYLSPLPISILETKKNSVNLAPFMVLTAAGHFRGREFALKKYWFFNGFESARNFECRFRIAGLPFEFWVRSNKSRNHGPTQQKPMKGNRFLAYWLFGVCKKNDTSRTKSKIGQWEVRMSHVMKELHGHIHGQYSKVT